MSPEHRLEVLDMIKAYVRWTEKNPDKWTQGIAIKAYWPLVGKKILWRYGKE
jgi:hypothetical protein